MASTMWGLAVMIVGLLVMVPQTMQLPMNHPLHSIVRRINDNEGPFLGLVLSSASDEKALLESGYFVANPRNPSVKIAGRTFSIGTFKDVPAIYTIALAPLASVSATVQILLDNFRIKGIIDYGGSATVSSKLGVADVAVLSHTAFTGVWDWKNDESSMGAEELPSLKIGDYNVPEAGDNKLASLQFQEIKKYTPKGAKKEAFWYYVDREWFAIASKLQEVPLERCTSENNCAEEVPKVVYGVRGASSDIYLENVEFGKFLSEKLDVVTVDRKLSAVVATAVANGVSHIAIRSPTNRPGTTYNSNLAALSHKNSLKAVAAFVQELVDREKSYNKYY